MVYRRQTLASVGPGSTAEYHDSVTLDANGLATFSLAAPPASAARVFVTCRQARRIANVSAVSGNSVTVLVVKAAAAAIAHTPTTDANFINATGALAQDAGFVPSGSGVAAAFNAPATTGSWVKNGCGAVGCDGASAQTAGTISTVQAPNMQGTISFISNVITAAGTVAKVAAVTAIANHAETNNPVAASETVDLIVFYEV